MFHEPSEPVREDPAFWYKRRVGVWMFLGYSVLYGTFIAINLIKPSLMGRALVSGLDLAVVYGLGLILSAIAFALLYNALCTRREKRSEGSGDLGSPTPGAEGTGRTPPRAEGRLEGGG